MKWNFKPILSLPELKAHELFPIAWLSSLRLSVNFSHCHLLLQNYRTNFTKLGTTYSLVKWIQVYSNEGPSPF